MAVQAKSMTVRERAVPRIMDQGVYTPWLFVLPSLLIVGVYIVYPVLNTIYLSLRNSTSDQWAPAACRAGQACWGIFENYRYALTSDVMLTAFRNNIIWLLVLVPGVTAIGLLIATLVDRVKYEAVAKSLIFMPMVISFVGAGIIWGFVYDYPVNPDNPNTPIIGLLNALIVAFGGRPVPFLQSPPIINNLALIVVGVWLYTGFSMTILSAAIKSVPSELLEASRIDGANEWQVFWKIMFPLIFPTITVVMTTMTMFTLKLFDLIYVMTGGNYQTDVIANRIYMEMYVNFETGRSAAITIILLLLIVPILIINVRRFAQQEAMR
jgi:alpha-glucoside transport system permease protein